MCEYVNLVGADSRKIVADASRENKKGYKVSGSRNPLSKRFWDESKDVQMQTVVTK